MCSRKSGGLEVIRRANTLILFAIAGSLLLYFLAVEEPRHRRALDQAESRSDLASFQPDSVAAVSIVRPDISLEFARDTSGWRMTAPFSEPADIAAVNLVIYSVSDAEIARDLGVQTDLVPFGLQDSSAVISLLSSVGDTIVALQVGGLTVDRSQAYARKRPSPEVILIPTGVRHGALQPPSAYRDKRIITFELQDAVRLTVAAGGGSTTWVRRQDGEWTTRSDGSEIRGDAQMVESLLRRLRGLRAHRFLEPSEVDSLRPPEHRGREVTVETAPGIERVLRVGVEMEDGVVAQVVGESRIAVTDTTLLAVFRATVAELRDRRLLVFDPSGPRRVSIEAPQLRMTLVRPGDEWGFPNPAMGRIDQTEVRELLTAIGRLRYLRVVAESGETMPYGLSKPEIALTIFDGSGAPIDRLICVRRGEDHSHYLANSRHAGVVAEVAAGAVDDLLARFQHLRDSREGDHEKQP
jgi:hypothetical protein